MDMDECCDGVNKEDGKCSCGCKEGECHCGESPTTSISDVPAKEEKTMRKENAKDCVRSTTPVSL